MPNLPHPRTPRTEPSFDSLLDPKSVATFLSVSVATLADWRCRGGGPRFTRAGHLVRYRMSALNEWLDGQEVSTNAERRDLARTR